MEKICFACKTYGSSPGPKICLLLRCHSGWLIASIQSSTSITRHPYFSVIRGREASPKKPCVDFSGREPTKFISYLGATTPDGISVYHFGHCRCRLGMLLDRYRCQLESHSRRYVSGLRVGPSANYRLCSVHDSQYRQYLVFVWAYPFCGLALEAWWVDIPYPMQPAPQLPTSSGLSKLAPSCFGADQKSFTEPGLFGRIVPSGISIESTPIRCPEYGNHRLWFKANGVSGFWKPSRFQYV